MTNNALGCIRDQLTELCCNRCIVNDQESNYSSATSMTSSVSSLPWNHRIRIDAQKIFHEIAKSGENFDVNMKNVGIQTDSTSGDESASNDSIIEINYDKTLEIFDRLGNYKKHLYENSTFDNEDEEGIEETKKESVTRSGKKYKD